jgi:hypothetical protein
MNEIVVKTNDYVVVVNTTDHADVGKKVGLK